MNKLEELQQKICELVPDIKVIKYGGRVNNKKAVIGLTTSRYINLEDILIALDRKEISIRIDTEGEFIKYKKTPKDDIKYKWEETGIFWELGKPLDQQSKECINLLHKTLC